MCLRQVILGALFHDVGHLVGKRDSHGHMVTNNMVLGTPRHEYIGKITVSVCVCVCVCV